MNQPKIRRSSPSDSSIVLVFGGTVRVEIRTESPRARASDHGGVGENSDFLNLIRRDSDRCQMGALLNTVAYGLSIRVIIDDLER